VVTILDTTDYDAIRAVLGADSVSLPDATFALFLGSADREVKRLVAGWASLTGDDLAALEQATIYLTAERIALATPATSEVSGLGYKMVQRGITPALLRALAYAELVGLGVVLSQSYGFSVLPTRHDGYADVEAAL
jgi:hypothetical protein